MYNSGTYIALGYIEESAKEIVRLSSILTGSRSDYQERMSRIAEIARRVEQKAKDA